jgi:hypothetical protein
MYSILKGTELDESAEEMNPNEVGTGRDLSLRVDKMEESINQSLQQAEALKQSILKKAFEGRLMAL